jgi:hypothetical protein
MPQFLLALFLLVMGVACTAVLLALFVDAPHPLRSAWRRARIGATIRRETSDLDRRYAALVEEHRRTP